MKYLIYGLLLLMGLLLCTPELLWADPPVFPGNPDQVPVDGGLGLLAAAGGAYAWRKLRKNNPA